MKNLLQPISNLFHPLFSLSWAVILLTICSPLCVLPLFHRMFIIMEVIFYSFLLPSLIIVLMSKFGIVKNGVALRDRRDRVIPLGVQMILYCILAMVLDAQHLPLQVLCVFWGAFAISIIFFIVTFFWKISAHAGCNAALATVSLILYYEFPNFEPLFVPLLLIVMTGAVSSIRVYLGRHTLAQVSVGALVGSLCIYVSYLYF